MFKKIFSIFRKSSVEEAAPRLPVFEEVFEVERALYIHDPFDTSEDSLIEESALQTITLTLIVGLREYLTKIHENPTNHHKALESLGKQLEANGVTPIAYTQWSQAPIQGLAAKVILRGKVRTALLGPSLAMVRNTAPLRQEFIDLNESATTAGNIVFLLAIDGLAYGAFEISHRIQEVI